MCARGSAAAARHRAGADQEGSLIRVAFVGSFPRADFQVSPPLPEVAFLGRSNVGKSSLINAVLRRKTLARTSKTPGKTRDCNVYNVNDALYLVDLPGYGYARVAKSERRRFGRLVDRYLATRQAMAGAVWLLDIRREPSEDDRRLADRLTHLGVPTLVALTKGDKFGRSRREERRRAIIDALGLPPEQTIVTSAVTKEGVDDLRESVLALGAPDADEAFRGSTP